MKNLKMEFGMMVILCLSLCIHTASLAQTAARSMKYTSRSEAAAQSWQDSLRADLFQKLKLQQLMKEHKSIALNPKLIRKENLGKYEMREVEINATATRRIRVIVTLPLQSKGPFPAVVSIHGHDGTSHIVYDTTKIYGGFAHKLASRDYVTIAPFVSQHDIYEDGDLLMGERLFDCIRSVDYLESLAEVDTARIGVAGLSLGGEMAMWMGAMDTRIKTTVSAGFLTKMDQLEHNHCLCWKFPGLREVADFSDIYSLTAPRPLMFQNGSKEPDSQFPPRLAREALAEVQVIYADMKRPENLVLDIHAGAHVVDVPQLLNFIDKNLAKRI